MKSSIWKHHFSSHVSRNHGVVPALLLRHLSDCIDRSLIIVDQEKWYGWEAEAEMLHFPYLTRSALDKGVHALERAKLIRHSYLEGASAPRRWYTAMPEDRVAARTQNIRLDVDVAAKLGLLAGIMIEEFRFRVTLNHTRCRENPTSFSTTHRRLAERLRFTESQFEEAIASLIAARLIIARTERPNTYRLSNDDPQYTSLSKFLRKASH